MSLIFKMKNPIYLVVAPLFLNFDEKKQDNPPTIPLNNGRGPELNTAYVLWQRDVGVKESDAIINPTVENHKGWTMISKGIFNGFEEIPHKRHDQQNWYPRMLNEIVYDPIYNVYPDIHRETIKFKRIDGSESLSWQSGSRGRNIITSNLYWQKILKPSKHPKLFKIRGEEMKTKLNTIVKGDNLGPLTKNGPDVFGEIAGFLGGKKNIRKRKKRKKTKKTKKRNI